MDERHLKRRDEYDRQALQLRAREQRPKPGDRLGEEVAKVTHDRATPNYLALVDLHHI